MPALVTLSLCFATACVEESDTDSTASETDGLSANASCTYHRPASWSIGRVTCRDGLANPITVLDGHQFTDRSNSGGIGTYTVQCNNGVLVTISKTCMPGPGNE